jgi:biopolymer transport protein ExbD
MDFRDPPRRKPEENLLPMINVIFLLLIFFLIAARMTAPEPFAVTPPQAMTEAEAQGDFTLFIAADGLLGYRDARDDAALAAIAASREDHCRSIDCRADPPRLTLRADNALPAVRLAALMQRLPTLGFDSIELVAIGGAAQ